ncbi:MAG: 1-acyl-sn-glycerol-3-phosphate acyltransferase [Planctomycetes bacterium]|nr:1-acyl-sn-glycerol-3-phosphate acyltransferase [Planctomycetota bacterium]
MRAEASAIGALAAYAAVAFGVLWWRARRCRAGVFVWFLYGFIRLYTGLMFGARTNRRCPYAGRSAGLIVANHRSPVDPLLLARDAGEGLASTDIRPVSFMMAAEHYRHPLLHPVLVRIQSIPVERKGRDMAAVRQALRRLKAGALVGIFPEARINFGEGLLPPSPGAAWLALNSGVPVYPVFIHGAPQSRNLVVPFFRPARVRLAYGDPLDLSPWAGQKATPAVLHEVAAAMMERLAELGQQAPGCDSTGPIRSRG